MNLYVRLATVVLGASALLITGLLSCDRREKPAEAPGVTPAPPPPKPEPPKAPALAEFHDTNFGFTVSVPAAWQNVPAAGVVVPGTVIKVWTPGGVATVVAFVQDAGQAVTARQMLDSSGAALKAAGLSVTFEQVVKVAGTDAMSLKVTGPGTGAALGNGTVQTYQHWVAVPRDTRVLVLLLTAPDASRTEPAAAFESMVSSLKLD